jgi:hypothetical protein
MRILVYKQTHLGDPDLEGAWRSCMGPIRLRVYDAVIAIGGISAEPQEWDIAGKVTWVGKGKQVRRGVVRFDHYRNFGNGGPLVKDVLPALARKMKGVRHRMVQNDDDVESFVEEFAGDAPASCSYDGSHPCCRPVC